jgi:hypothetical protein
MPRVEHAADDSLMDGKIGSEIVHGLIKRLALVLAIRCDAWKIYKFNQNAAVTAGRKLGGVRKFANDLLPPGESLEPALEFRTL